MMKRRNGFLFFCCSLIPGAGEMYMGFMKMGISLMGIFFLSFFLTDLTGVSVLALISTVIWFYSFFHAHNLAGMPDAQFAEMKDDYMFQLGSLKKGSALPDFYRKVIAFVMIFVGVVFLWKDVVCDFILQYCGLTDFESGILNSINDMIPKVVIAIAIIILGIHMIKGKKSELAETESEENDGE